VTALGGWGEDGGSTFLSHHPVVGVPVVVGSTSRGEDGAKQQPQLCVIDIGVGVVESDQLRRTFDGSPLPAGAGNNGGSGISAQIAQLAGGAGGYEPDELNTSQRVLQNPGVDHRRLGAAIAAQSAEHTKPVVDRRELSEGC